MRQSYYFFVVAGWFLQSVGYFFRGALQIKRRAEKINMERDARCVSRHKRKRRERRLERPARISLILQRSTTFLPS